MSFSDFGARWRQMEEEHGLPLRSEWARLPEGEFNFLQPDELAFLRETGLPDSAPCLSFEAVVEGMPRVDGVYSPRDEEFWARIGRDSVATFRMLGSDGSGNPLVLNINSRDIWLLDHEGSFTPYSLVNSGLAQFAESLLLFNQAILQEEVDVAALQEQLQAIDPRAAQEGAFWHGHAEDLPDLL